MPKFNETYANVYLTYILPFVLPVAHVGLMGSTYSTLALGIERYVAVCHPFQARRYIHWITKKTHLPCSIHMQLINIRRPAAPTKQNISKQNINNFCSSFNNTLFGTYCVQIGQLLESWKIREISWLASILHSKTSKQRFLNEPSKTQCNRFGCKSYQMKSYLVGYNYF